VNRDTMKSPSRSRNGGVIRFPSERTPKHHGPNVVDSLAALRHCGAASANHAVRTFREVLNDLTIIAGRDPIARAWFERTLQPAFAACANPENPADAKYLASAYMRADAESDVAIGNYLQDPSDENWRKVELTVGQEGSRGAEFLAAERARRAAK
jgi:hypothetical protein